MSQEPRSSQQQDAGNPIWERVAAELKELADTLNEGGIEAAAKKFKVTRRPDLQSSPEGEPTPEGLDTPS